MDWPRRFSVLLPFALRLEYGPFLPSLTHVARLMSVWGTARSTPLAIHLSRTEELDHIIAPLRHVFTGGSGFFCVFSNILLRTPKINSASFWTVFLINTNKALLMRCFYSVRGNQVFTFSQPLSSDQICVRINRVNQKWRSDKTKNKYI